MKKSKVISLLLILSFFAFLMEAEKAAKNETPVNPTDTPYVTGDKTLDNFNLGNERNNLIKYFFLYIVECADNKITQK